MWKAQELLDSLNRECSLGDIIELYSALLAYELGLTEINEELTSKVMHWYYDNDALTTFINAEVYDYAQQLLNDK